MASLAGKGLDAAAVMAGPAAGAAAVYGFVQRPPRGWPKRHSSLTAVPGALLLIAAAARA